MIRATPRRAAILCAAEAAILGYALHRLVFAIGEPSPLAVGPGPHIPYFWRAATAAWWASLAAAAGWRFPQVEPVAARALPWVVAVAVAIAVFVP